MEKLETRKTRNQESQIPPLMREGENSKIAWPGQLPVYLSWAIALVAVLVMAGWQFDQPLLRTLFPHTVSMNPLTAMLFLLTAASIFFYTRPGSHSFLNIAAILSLLVAASGILRLAELQAQFNIGLDTLLFPAKLKYENGGFGPNRMAPNTAFNFFFLGLSLFLCCSERKALRNISGILSTLVLSVSLFSVLGYLYQVRLFYAYKDYIPMAIPTAISFLLAALSVLSLNSGLGFIATFTSPLAGGSLARKLFPAVLLLPVIFGYLQLSAYWWRPYPVEMGTAALITSIVFTFFGLIWYLTAALNRSDLRRSEAEELLVKFNRGLESLVDRRTSELKASEQKYLHTLESMIEGVQIIDFNWKYVFVNDAAVSHARLQRQQLIGFTMMEKFPGIENSELFGTLRQCMELRTSQYIENEFVYPDGSSAHFELSINAIPEGVFILSVDVTEQKRAREKILKANRLYAFISAINQSIVHIDNHRDLLENACHTALRIGKYQIAWVGLLDQDDCLQVLTYKGPEEMRSAALLYAGRHPADTNMQFTLAGRVLQTGQFAASNDLSHEFDPGRWYALLIENGIRSCIVFPISKFGKTRGILVFCSNAKGIFDASEIALLKEAAGDISFALEIFEKDTLRREAEAEIVALNESLEAKVKQRTAELEDVNKELETFNYTVAHDLQAPLRLLNGFARIIVESYSDKLDEEGVEMLNVLNANANRMSALVKDLLHFSRLGREPIDKKEVNMTEMAAVVLAEYKTAAENHRAEVSLKELKNCYCDPALMRQVWSNLIGNAIKYSSKKEMPEIEIGTKLIDGKTTYYIKDNGDGFDLKYAHKLFRVFQRMHGADEFEGTGVGLATVHRIITRHGGSIWADAKKNEGATFFFSLPEN